MNMNNQLGNYKSLQEKITQLQSKNQLSTHSIMFSIWTPYFSFLGYEVYDLDTVTNDFDRGILSAKINQNITLTASFDEHTVYELTNDNDKMFLHYDLSHNTFTLYFKVLDDWKQVEKVNFNLDGGNAKDIAEQARQEQERFMRLTKYVRLKDVVGQYSSKKERFFTEIVVDEMLDKGDWNNVFVQQSLANEFMNPSQEMIQLLAARLGKDYTTQSVESIAEKLKPILEEGLSGLVDYIVNIGMLPTSSSSYTPAPTQTFSKEKVSAKLDEKPEQGQADLSNMKDELSSLGFKLDEPKEEKVVEEPKVVAEKTTNLEDLELGTDGSISLDGLF